MIKVLIAFMGLILVACVYSLGRYGLSFDQQEDFIVKSYKIYFDTFTLTNAIAAQFYERYGDVQAFATHVKKQYRDVKELEHAFNDYVRLYSIYDVILFVDPDGHYLASNSLDAQGRPLDIQVLKDRNYSQEKWFQKVLKKELTEDAKKGMTGVYFEDAEIDAISSLAYKETRYGSGFSTAVHAADGHLIGILTDRANFLWVENEFRSLYKSLSSFGLSSVELTLIRGDGALLVDYDPQTNQGDLNPVHDFGTLLKFNLRTEDVEAAREALKGRSSVNVSFHARKKIHQLVGFSPVKSEKFIDSIGWAVLVRIDKDEILSGVLQSKRNFFVSMILFVVFILGTLSIFMWYTLGRD